MTVENALSLIVLNFFFREGLKIINGIWDYYYINYLSEVFLLYFV